MARGTILAAVAIALAGCSTIDYAGKRWVRTDGRPGDLQSDLTICNGEARKAEMTAIRPSISGLDDIALGCMASRGWALR